VVAGFDIEFKTECLSGRNANAPFTPPELMPVLASATDPFWQVYPHQPHAGTQGVPGGTAKFFSSVCRKYGWARPQPGEFRPT
jgi:hypothetical protein